MKTITETVSKLRLEAYLGQIVLKVGLESLVLSDEARTQLFVHLFGRGVALFINERLPVTLICQNVNYLLANYTDNTIATMGTKECSSKIVDNIKFAAPETEEDFNR